MKHIVFFYGTLKRGLENNFRLAGQEFLREAVTEPDYAIVSIGQYGGLIRVGSNGLAVKGELWALDEKCLAEIDEFETGEGLWERFPVSIVGADNVESYMWTGDVPGDAQFADVWLG